MKQRAMDSDVLYFSEEIIRNILKRLPVKSLIRFQCVCKLWKNLIKNPAFIAGHLQHSSLQNPSLLIKSREGNNFLSSLHLLDCELQLREVQKTQLLNSLNAVNIVGCCNGLLCLDYKHDNPLFLLWNPVTTAVRHVPRTGWFGSFSECVSGFGFSPVVNDYKIVVTYAESDESVSRAGVFSLSSGTWKEIDIGDLEGVKVYADTVTANGCIFWSGLKLGEVEEDEDDSDAEGYEDILEHGEFDVEVIVCFDIAKEVFTVIERLGFDVSMNQRLTVYENKLAILCRSTLWVFDEGMLGSGSTWTWTKLYSISLDSCTLHAMAILGNKIVCEPVSEKYNDKGIMAAILGNKSVCEPVSEEYNDEGNDEGISGLFLINPATNEVKRFTIPFAGPFYNIYNYVESLVPVGNN